MVIGQSLTGYEPGAVTAPHTIKPHRCQTLARYIAPQEPVINAGAGDSEAPFLYVSLRSFLLEIDR